MKKRIFITRMILPGDSPPFPNSSVLCFFFLKTFLKVLVSVPDILFDSSMITDVKKLNHWKNNTQNK